MSNPICKNYFRRIVEDSQSLFEWWIRTLMAALELIFTSRPLTVDTISDSKSEIPFSQSKFLTIKTNVAMPPSGEFSKPDVYSKRRWQHVQYNAREFWSRWRKEFVQSLQIRYMEKKDTKPCNWGYRFAERWSVSQWSMPRIVGMHLVSHLKLLIRLQSDLKISNNQTSSADGTFPSRWSHNKINKIRVVLWGARLSGVIWT